MSAWDPHEMTDDELARYAMRFSAGDDRYRKVEAISILYARLLRAKAQLEEGQSR